MGGIADAERTDVGAAHGSGSAWSPISGSQPSLSPTLYLDPAGLSAWMPGSHTHRFFSSFGLTDPCLAFLSRLTHDGYPVPAAPL